MIFAKNMGSFDRMARLIVGLLLMVLAFAGTIGIWGWLGAILVGTSFLNFCPIYRIFGIKTCSEC